MCPKINDGKILEKSIYDLAEFHKKSFKTVLSTAIVPVGLTKFRPENDGLIAITKEYARAVSYTHLTLPTILLV